MDGSRVTKDRAKALRRIMSLPEVLLWKAIKGGAVDRLHFRNQHPIGPYVLDFYCDAAKLAVEVDGASHGAGDRPVRDERRDTWLAARGIATLRLPASLILRDVDDAVRTIAGYLQHGD
jgi:very-short-patch-repair endonuclease